MIRRLGKLNSIGRKEKKEAKNSERPIRIATFNVAMFSLAPAVSEQSSGFGYEEEGYMGAPMSPFEFDIQGKSPSYHPKSILKQSPLQPSPSPDHKVPRSKMKVSINLPDNEISLARSSDMFMNRSNKNNVVMRSPVCLPASMMTLWSGDSLRCSRSIEEVLKEVDADILALQDVKADEEKDMKPLSDLAAALGMKYIFAESWAPQYGNAILSKFPIKRWTVQKIADDDDFRNVLKATIEVPWAGDVNFYCTQLDHLDENWRLKQVRAMLESNNPPHLLLGGLNALNGSDYSFDRWKDIVKYYEDIGKPTPRLEVMKFFKGKEYSDAKDYAGECEPVVIIAKGQNVQGTCKYGTRVDYILASSNSPYRFVPGSYSVISSKGTSDHHIVKVDVVKLNENYILQDNVIRRGQGKPLQKVVSITNSSCSPGIWKLSSSSTVVG